MSNMNNTVDVLERVSKQTPGCGRKREGEDKHCASVTKDRRFVAGSEWELRMPVETGPGNYFVSNYPPYSKWTSDWVGSYEDALRERSPGAGGMGLYVHIPFCRQRCMYCYFRVHIRRPIEEVEQYIDAVLREAALYGDLPAVRGRRVANAYFGGGTPTHLSTEQIERLIGGLRRRLDWSSADEVTCECQPGTFGRDKLEALKGMGVTRASIGVQTFTDAVLRGVGRVAGERDCLDGYGMAREVGFREVNLDLMAGLPGETDESWYRTIDRVIGLGPDCVTIYQFELTHNSLLYKGLQAGRKVVLADWPTKRRWVGEAFDRLQSAGYRIYGAYWAVRDPARNRFAYVTEHYWRGEDLLGLGETAFGYLRDHHYQNADTFDSYTGNCAEGRLPVRRAYRMSPEEKMRRQFILQLKTGRVDLDRLRATFQTDVTERFGPVLDRLRNRGLLWFDDHQIVLTRQGLLAVDWFLPGFYLSEHQGVRYT